MVYSGKHDGLIFLKSDGSVYSEKGNKINIFQKESHVAFSVESQTALAFELEGGKICGTIQSAEL